MVLLIVAVLGVVLAVAYVSGFSLAVASVVLNLLHPGGIR